MRPGYVPLLYLVQQLLQHREVDLAHHLVYVDSGQPLPVQLSVPGQGTAESSCRGRDVGVAMQVTETHRNTGPAVITRSAYVLAGVPQLS